MHTLVNMNSKVIQQERNC